MIMLWNWGLGELFLLACNRGGQISRDPTSLVFIYHRQPEIGLAIEISSSTFYTIWPQVGCSKKKSNMSYLKAI